MPPLLIIAAVGAGAIAGFRLAKALAGLPQTETSKTCGEHPISDEPRDLGALEYDQATGLYKPRP